MMLESFTNHLENHKSDSSDACKEPKSVLQRFVINTKINQEEKKKQRKINDGVSNWGSLKARRLTRQLRGRRVCHQAWQRELNPWDPHVERDERGRKDKRKKRNFGQKIKCSSSSCKFKGKYQTRKTKWFIKRSLGIVLRHSYWLEDLEDLRENAGSHSDRGRVGHSIITPSEEHATQCAEDRLPTVRAMAFNPVAWQ